MRRFAILAGSVFVAESALYSTITPLLAHYADTIGISRVEAGVLNATYAMGLIPGSLLAMYLSPRVGVRRLTIAGVAAFAITTAAFGMSSQLLALDLTRAAQGLAVGSMWGGMLSWLVAVAPRERRGEYLGVALGISILGALLGPVIGIAAVTLGSEVTFSIAGLITAMLILPLLRTADPGPLIGRQPASVSALARSASLRFACWLIFLSAAGTAVISTLLPLRLESAGTSAGLTGFTFLVGSVVAAIGARHFGTEVDRRGSFAVGRQCLLLSAPLFVALSLDTPAFVLALLTVLSMGTLVISVPAAGLLTESAQKVGLGAGFSAPLLLLSLALGESIGPPLGAMLATATNDAIPFLLLASLTLCSVLAIPRSRTRLHRSV